MHEQPGLSDTLLRATVEAHYGFCIARLTFLPIGNDSASFVYRVESADDTVYFLKLRKSAGFSAPSLLIPRFLSEQGIPHIVAPLPTLSQDLWVCVDDFVVTLYPFIDARTGTAVGLAAAHWVALGAALRQIHAGQLPANLRQILAGERFIPSRRHVLTELASMRTGPHRADPLQRELFDFWRSREDEIERVIETADMLGDQLRPAALDHVLCHADLHTWNVLIDAQQQMWIVDRDETLLAPKERDLMFVIGGIAQGLVSAQETAHFLQGYGPTSIDQQALTYYRYAWAVQDMGAYAEDVFFAPHLSQQSRRSSLRAFIGLFEPGNIVTIATKGPDGL